jgi:hypothetical protein
MIGRCLATVLEGTRRTGERETRVSLLPLDTTVFINGCAIQKHNAEFSPC